MSFDMVNYSVCCWFGPRGSKKYNDFIESDKFYFVNKHLDFLNTYSKGNIKKATFVINSRPDEDIESVKKFFDDVKLNNGIEVDYFFRDNKGSDGSVKGSYGAWDDAIVRNIDFDVDNFLLFEDDYILVDEDCVEPFIIRSTEKTPLVCCYVMKPNQWCIAHPSHAGVMCLNKVVCKQMYDKYNEVLYFQPPNSDLSDYSNICNVQVYCQKHFTDEGYKLADVLDEYSTGYLYCNQPGYGEELLVVFGDSQNETLVIPIGYKDYEYEDPYALMPNIHTR